MVEKLEESVGKSLKQNKKTILLLKKAPKPNPPPKSTTTKKQPEKTNPKTPRKKDIKSMLWKLRWFFLLFQEQFPKKKLNLL